MSLAHGARYASLCFISGCGLGSIFFDTTPLTFNTYLLASAIGIGVIIIVPWRIILLSGAALVIGFVYVNVWHDNYTARLTSLKETGESYEGYVTFVEPYIDKQRLTVRVSAPRDFLGVDLFVYVRRYPVYQEGTHLKFSCVLSNAADFEDFRYDRYIERYGIYKLCFYPYRIERTSGERSPKLFQGKHVYESIIRRSFPEPVGSFLSAITLRQSKEFPENLRKQFAESGIAHILAISGLHISFIILLLDQLLMRLYLGRSLRLLSIIVFLISYLFLIGFPSSAVRAAIMGVAVLIGYLSGRNYRGMHILILTAGFLTIMNPLLVAYDIGFQLSFLSIAGILLTYDIWSTSLRCLPERYGIRSLIALTLSAQTFTWPFIIYYFQTFSIIAPLTNIFVIPLTAVLMIGSFFIPVIPISGILAPFIIMPLYCIARLIIFVAVTASNVPYSFISVSMNASQVLLGSSLTFFIVMYLRKNAVFSK